MTSFIALALLASASFATAYVHQVSVGDGGQLVYNPPFINASVGDVVLFNFFPKNHTVSQSSFDEPCTPLAGGFDSGFKPVSPGSYDLQTFQITVNVTTPLWAHCRQIGHCGEGMVFGINPPLTGNTFAAFQAKALASGNASSTTSSASASESTTSYSSTTCDAATVTQTVVQTITSTETKTVTEGSTSTTTASSHKPTEHKVSVGGTNADGTPKLAYDPPFVFAKPGDLVRFIMHPKNHTVTQSSFGAPCTKLENSTNGAQKGFDSGFIPVSANLTQHFPEVKITVKDTNPFWIYCRQTNHCLSGMVFAINPPKEGPHTFDAFLQLALHSNATTLTASPTGYTTTSYAAPTASSSNWA